MNMLPQATATMEKFGHPATLVGETRWWAALFRRKQVTLGSLVLAAKAPVTSFAALPQEAFSDLAAATRAVERTLADFKAFDRINYLMLMMVDPHPHFHVLPRYSAPREIRGAVVADVAWPGAPALDKAVELEPQIEAAAIAELRALWVRGAS